MKKASEVRQSQWNPKRMNSGFSFEMFSLLGLTMEGGKETINSGACQGEVQSTLEILFSGRVSKPSFFMAG